MEETSFSYKTLRNSFYLFANFLVPLAIGIFVTRSMAIKLGANEFGVFLLLNAISSFVNFVDLDLAAAVTKYSAEYYGAGNLQSMRNLLSSARLLFIFIGLLGLLVFFILGKWFLPAFQVIEQSQPHIFVVFLLAGTVFFINCLNVYPSVLHALQRFDITAKLSMASLIITSLGTLVLLQMNFRLKAIMALNVAVAFLAFLAYRYYAGKLLPELRLNFSLVASELKKAYSFGLLTFISNLASTALIYLDRVLIPIFLGPASLPFYSVPGNVATKTSMVTNSLGGMFFPMASSLAGAGQLDKLKAVYIRAFRNLHVIAAGVSVAIFMFAEKILFFWLGQEYADKSTGILKILAVTYFIVALYIPLQSILLGLGKLRFLIKQSLVMTTINLTLLIILIPKFGIQGAAWAYLVAVLPMPYAFYWTEKNLFAMSGQFKSYLNLYLKLIFTAAVHGGLIHFFILQRVNDVFSLIVLGPLSVLLYFGLYYLFGFVDEEDTQLIKGFLLKFLRLKK